MRAVRFHGREDLRVDNIPEPQCAENQVKIAPAFVGICGSDLHEYLSGPTWTPTKPHPVTGEVVPIGFGHEFSGVVTEVGKGVDKNLGLKKGDNVAVQPTICCWKCGPCKDGALNCCDTAGFLGFSGGGGGMSDFICVDSYFVHKLPDNIPLDVGALVEPIAVAWHAVDASPIQEGDSALVMGAGPIGLAVIQSLVARGAKSIIVAEVSSERQKFAKQFGAHHIFDPREDDIVKLTKELTEGRGAHIAFDCAGVPSSPATAILAVRAKGTIVNVAMWEKETDFNPNLLVFGEKKYIAVLGYQKPDFHYVIKAIGDGVLQPEKMITKKIKIDEVVEEGFRTLKTKKDKQVKILIDVHA